MGYGIWGLGYGVWRMGLQGLGFGLWGEDFEHVAVVLHCLDLLQGLGLRVTWVPRSCETALL
jgi:hypothetical protein